MKKEIKKIIHYSRTGYNGNYTYTSVCGKEINSHKDDEECSVHPEEANCKECKKTAAYKTDLHDRNNLDGTIKRRIYIESDILHANEFRTAQRKVREFLEDTKEKCVERVFQVVHDYAWHHLEQVWADIKNADEVWATSSLMPLIGGSYMGAPVIFNGMCERAVKENVTGKTVVILNTLKNINWHMIQIDVMKQAFKNNTLLMYDENYNKLIKIDVFKIKK